MSKADATEESRFDQNMSLHPYFNFDVLLNVTARVGQTAFLHCKVEQLGDKSVSKKKLKIFLPSARQLLVACARIMTTMQKSQFTSVYNTSWRRHRIMSSVARRSLSIPLARAFFFFFSYVHI